MYVLTNRFFVVVVSTMLLLLTGCAAPTQSVKFTPAIESASFTPRQKAETTKKTNTQLVRQDYVRIGELDVEYIISQCEGKNTEKCSPVKQDTTPSVRLMTEAASRGGDLVRITKNNKEEQSTRYDTGSCLKTSTRTETVLVPRYSYECRRVGNNQECATVQRGSEFKTRDVTVCVQHEQLPKTVKVLRSTGTVWRHDKKYSANERRCLVLEHGSRKQVKRLLKNKKGMATAMLDNDYPIRVALKSDNAEAIKAMLDLGMKPAREVVSYRRSNGDYTTYPLVDAVEYNAEKSVITLLQHGVKPWQKPLLRSAIEVGNPRILENILSHRAKKKVWQFEMRYFPSHTNKHKPKIRERLLEILLSNGANINAVDYEYGWTALSSAAAQGDYDAVKLLLKYGADKNIKSKSGKSPLARAIRSREDEPQKKKQYDAIISILGK